jgi:hypothetical protein
MPVGAVIAPETLARDATEEVAHRLRPPPAGLDGSRRPRGQRQGYDRFSVVDVKGYRREDAKEKKKATMDTYGVPAVNNLRTLSRWAFVELTEIDQIDADFKAKVDREFDAMLARVSGVSPKVST